MKIIVVTFYACKQHKQTMGTENDYLAATLYFRIAKQDFQVFVRQPQGGKENYEVDPLEAEMPDSLKGKIQYEDFRSACEQYYRSQFGSSGSAINVSGSSVVMSNNIIGSAPHNYKVRVIDSGGQAW